jgi:hypothetical protein
MTLSQWTGSYVLNTLFWLWVVRWGGAEWLVEQLSSVLLISALVPRRTVAVIKLLGWVILVTTRVWFLVGLFFPGARF